MINLNPFSGQTHEPSLIPKHSKDWKVYKISDNHVAKIPRQSFRALETLGLSDCIQRYWQEPLITRAMYEKGISVIKPEGIFQVPAGIECDGSDSFAFVMEYVDGKTLKEQRNTLPGAKFEEIKKLYYGEVDKAGDLGFIAGDAGDHNCIWLPEKEKLYLIDFFEWNFSNSQLGRVA
ncbi:MAG: hypothetical protein Q8N63_06930 [Nanoarchaeota archaeon]|nr:hypothetical protein [Nanoarchaeota archaeon]